MLHIVESCPLTKLNGGLSRLHSVDEDGVLWTQCTCNSYRQLNINFYTSYLGPLALAKMSLISRKRKYGGHFKRLAPIGRRNTPHHSYIAVHARK